MKAAYVLITIFTLVYIVYVMIFFYQGKIPTFEFLTLISVWPLVMIALFQEKLKRWFFAPKLVIDFELEAPFCSKTPFFLGWQTPEGEMKVNTEAYAFRFGVRNDGESQARLCEAFIAELKEEKENKWVDVEYFQQVHLRWDKGKESENLYTHINPSSVRRLCIIGYITKPAEGLPEDEAKWFRLTPLYSIGGYQPQYLKPGKYRLKVTVAAENAKPVSQNFELLWSGVWKDKPEETFREINIRRV